MTRVGFLRIFYWIRNSNTIKHHFVRIEHARVKLLGVFSRVLLQSFSFPPPKAFLHHAMLLTALESATASSSDFGLDNLPLGVFTNHPLVSRPRCCTRIGDIIVDLAVLEEAAFFQDIPGLSAQVFCRETLNAFLAHPKPVWVAVRARLTKLLSGNLAKTLDANAKLQEAAFHLVSAVKLHLPIQIGDYTDFYASREHATNVGYVVGLLGCWVLLIAVCECVPKVSTNLYIPILQHHVSRKG